MDLLSATYESVTSLLLALLHVGDSGIFSGGLLQICRSSVQLVVCGGVEGRLAKLLQQTTTFDAHDYILRKSIDCMGETSIRCAVVDAVLVVVEHLRDLLVPV